VDRLTSIDFQGLQYLADDVIVRRPRSNAVSLFFPETGETYELAIHKRRDTTVRKDRTAEKVGNGRGRSVKVETESKPGGQDEAQPATAAKSGSKGGRSRKNRSGQTKREAEPVG